MKARSRRSFRKDKCRIKMKFGELCREKRERLGLKQKEVAEQVGCKPEYISNIETGVRYPGLGTTLKLAEVLNIEDAKRFYMGCLREQVPDEFKHIYEGPTEAEMLAKLKELGCTVWKGKPSYFDTVAIEDLGNEYQKVPYYDPASLIKAMENGLNFDNAKVSKYPVVLFPGKGTPHCFAVSASDNSMAPAIQKKDIVVICKGEVEPGRIGLFQFDRSIALKRLAGENNGQVVLTSDNQTGYPPLFKSKDEICVIGRVISLLWRDFE